MKRNTTPQTEAISRIDTSGNMIPVNWYKTIQKQESKSGKIARKPHLLAINILADIVYWHKNTVIRDEITAEIIEIRKRFAADLLQRSYASIVNMFGCSDKDAREAVAFLESLGLITRVFRNLSTPNGIMPNVMYINIHAKVIEMATITNTPLPQVSEIYPQNEGDVPPKEETCTDEMGDYTDTTTNTTNETTKEEYTPLPNGKNKPKNKCDVQPIPTCLDTPQFVEAWVQLLETKKWRTKEASAINLALKKLSAYDVAFAIQLVETAIMGGYQGVVFTETKTAYEKWQKTKQTSSQTFQQPHPNFPSRPLYVNSFADKWAKVKWWRTNLAELENGQDKEYSFTEISKMLQYTEPLNILK